MSVNLFSANLTDFTISVRDTTSVDDNIDMEWMICANVTDEFGLGETRDIFCTVPIEGNEVRISLEGENRVLQLCEVEIYGLDLTGEQVN